MTVVRLEWAGQEREVRLEEGAAFLDGERVSFREIRRERGALVALEIAGDVFPLRVARRDDHALVGCAGAVFELRRVAGVSRRRSVAAGDSHAGLVAPMPGRIRRALVRRGDEVTKGQVVLILEAMKMEHAIRAPHDGIVTRLEHREGDLVEAGAVLAEIG